MRIAAHRGCRGWFAQWRGAGRLLRDRCGENAQGTDGHGRCAGLGCCRGQDLPASALFCLDCWAGSLRLAVGEGSAVCVGPRTHAGRGGGGLALAWRQIRALANGSRVLLNGCTRVHSRDRPGSVFWCSCVAASASSLPYTVGAGDPGQRVAVSGLRAWRASGRAMARSAGRSRARAVGCSRQRRGRNSAGGRITWAGDAYQVPCLLHGADSSGHGGVLRRRFRARQAFGRAPGTWRVEHNTGTAGKGSNSRKVRGHGGIRGIHLVQWWCKRGHAGPAKNRSALEQGSAFIPVNLPIK